MLKEHISAPVKSILAALLWPAMAAVAATTRDSSTYANAGDQLPCRPQWAHRTNDYPWWDVWPLTL